MDSYKNRDRHLHQLITFQDPEPVKIITGVRRCGKFTVMKLIIQQLKGTRISAERFN